MTTHLAFLRAVHVGSHGAIPMADLRAWLVKLGFADVRTLLHAPARLCARNRAVRPAVKALQAASKGREEVRARGRHAYVIYPDGTGRSKLTLPLIERRRGTRGTGRNWNTVLKMAALAET